MNIPTSHIHEVLICPIICLYIPLYPIYLNIPCWDIPLIYPLPGCAEDALTMFPMANPIEMVGIYRYFCSVGSWKANPEN